MYYEKLLFEFISTFIMFREMSKRNINNFVMADQKRAKAYGVIQISTDSFFLNSGAPFPPPPLTQKWE